MSKFKLVSVLVLVLSLTSLNNWVKSQDTYFNGNVACTQTEYQAIQLVNESVTLLRNNNNQEAVDKLEQAVKLGPKLYQAHYNLGIALGKVNQFDRAIEEFKQAIDLNPNFSSAFLCLGGVYQSSGHINESLITYKEYVKRFPQEPSVPQVKKLIEGLSSQALVSAGQSQTNDFSNYINEIPVNDRNTWPQSLMPLKVFISDGSGVKGYQPFFKPALVEAFQDYEKVLNGRVKFIFTDNSNEANIICTWTCDLDKFKDGAEAGFCQITRNDKGIVKADIELLTLSINHGLDLSRNRLHAICLHEIGHALGIGGHSTNYNDIMYFSTPLNDENKELSNRDINTVNLLYNNN